MRRYDFGREEHLLVVFPHFHRESLLFQFLLQPDPTATAHHPGRQFADEVIKVATEPFAPGHVDQYQPATFFQNSFVLLQHLVHVRIRDQVEHIIIHQQTDRLILRWKIKRGTEAEDVVGSPSLLNRFLALSSIRSDKSIPALWSWGFLFTIS